MRTPTVALTKTGKPMKTDRKLPDFMPPMMVISRKTWVTG
jgi:hypothetical protein